jgi:hypothetical protein
MCVSRKSYLRYSPSLNRIFIEQLGVKKSTTSFGLPPNPESPHDTDCASFSREKMIEEIRETLDALNIDPPPNTILDALP